MTKEKLSLILNKINLAYIFALFVLLVNIIMVFVFKNSSIRPTYFCRWLSLVSMIICLIVCVGQLTFNIYKFIKNKENKIKFIVGTCFLAVALILVLYSTIKYFLDNSIYFYHINQTSIIFSCALIFMCLFYLTDRFEDRKVFQWAGLLLLATSLIALIFMIINVHNRDINIFYTMFTLLVIALWLCASLPFKNIGHKVTKYGFSLFSFALFITSLIINIFSRVNNDILSIISFFLIIDVIAMICLMIFDGQQNDNIVQFVLKVVALLLFLSAFIKLVVNDGIVLRDMDITRIVMFAGFIIYSLNGIQLFKNKITIGYIILQIMIGIVGIVLALTISQGVTIESYYIAMVVLNFVILGLYIAYETISYKQQKSKLIQNSNE